MGPDGRTGLLLACLLAPVAPAQVELLGTGCGSPAPGIAAGGSIVPGQTAQVYLSGAPPGAFTYFLLGTSDSDSAFGPLPLDLSAFPEFAPGCRLLTSAETTILLNAGPQGTLKLSFKLPASLGSDLYAQWAVVESLAPLQVTLTPALHICLQTDPDLSAAIVAPQAFVDWDGDGLATVERPVDRIFQDRVVGEERDEPRVVARILDPPELPHHGERVVVHVQLLAQGRPR